MSIAVLPPGPSEWKIKQLIQFIKKPIQYFDNCKNQFGKTFTLRLPGQPPYVVISDPSDIKRVFTSPPNQLHAGEINSSVLKPVLGNFSLLTLDGNQHMQHRKLLLPSFHGERMQLYGQSMETIVYSHIKKWKVGTCLSIGEEIRCMTFHIILKTIFGLDENNKRFNKLENTLSELLFTIKKPFGFITLLNKPLHMNLGPLTPWAKIVNLKK